MFRIILNILFTFEFVDFGMFFGEFLLTIYKVSDKPEYLFADNVCIMPISNFKHKLSLKNRKIVSQTKFHLNLFKLTQKYILTTFKKIFLV